MSCSDEEILACLKASVLDENRPLLCKTLDPKLHYPYLRSKYVLSEDDEELIEVQQLKKLKVHKFIDILMKKGRKGFDELVISIIQERTQIFLAEALNKAFEEKRKRLQALRASSSNTGSPAGVATDHGHGLDQKIEDLSISTSSIMNLPKFTDSQPDIGNRNSAPLPDSWSNSLSDLGVDTDTLPKPVMPKSNGDDLKFVRKKSCENSFDEDLNDIKSLPDSISSESESKA
ncbi:caspase recruitment domain-containing protein 9-like [Mercenaria mercenaria]|uniref:caspase recruitment domain-containing protein 9-like n=1 Tax=Mercenaria mercenaria TaxID=6596 RepID=UPI00234F998D|nr:caspase recruitment domain-containing protein 9-like [Mercenaria mercenaria]